MIRDGDRIKLRSDELAVYLELGQNEYEPTTVVELNAGVLGGIAYWERREASGLGGSRTFIELLRRLLVVDGPEKQPPGDTS